MQLLCHLLFENIRSTSRCDKAQERRRRIKRTRAELRVRLQANEERMIYRECILK